MNLKNDKLSELLKEEANIADIRPILSAIIGGAVIGAAYFAYSTIMATSNKPEIKEIAVLKPVEEKTQDITVSKTSEPTEKTVSVKENNKGEKERAKISKPKKDIKMVNKERLYRIKVTTTKTREEAIALARKIKESFPILDPFVEFKNGHFIVYAGSYKKTNYIEMAKKASMSLGYTPELIPLSSRDK